MLRTSVALTSQVAGRVKAAHAPPAVSAGRGRICVRWGIVGASVTLDAAKSCSTIVDGCDSFNPSARMRAVRR